MTHLPRGPLVSSFFRCFLIQGSWNYNTMLGSGFAYALLPILRHLAPDAESLEDSVGRHMEHFNAHPYLVGVAVGAVARMEADGVSPDIIRRFKTAVRGPLGGLGDTLVWASFLPATTLLALILLWMGAPAWSVVLVFLALYNVGHLFLRLWGFRVGLREGLKVGAAIQAADLGQWTERLRGVATLLMGILMGLLLTSPGGLWSSGAGWTGLAALTFAIGAAVGHRVWRPAAAVVVAVVAALTLWSMGAS